MNNGKPVPEYRNYTEKEIIINEDIRQGCNISSTLFNIYLDRQGTNFLWWHLLFVSCHPSGV
jgi:hypothetical protein